MLTLALVLLAIASGTAGAATACGVNMIFTLRTSIDRSRPRRIALAYLFGSAVGAGLVGGCLGIFAAIARWLVPLDAPSHRIGVALVLLSASVLLGLGELGFLRFRVPQRESQLNVDALRASRQDWKMFGFGLWLGMGFLTFSPYAGLHLLALACVLLGDFSQSLMVFTTFGVARGLTVVILALSARSWDQAGELADRVAASSGVAHRITALGQSLVAIAAAFAVLGS